MSLKTFHLIFISTAVLLAVGFGYWCIRQTGPAGSGMVMAGVASFAAAIGLIVYEIGFLRKMRKIK